MNKTIKTKVKDVKAITLIALIIAISILLILVGGIVYAATSASSVAYTTEQNAEIESVEEALNDLYSKLIIESNDFEVIGNNMGNNITIPAGYRYVMISNGYISNVHGYARLKEVTAVTSNTNSIILKSQDDGITYSSTTTVNMHVFAKIIDPSTTSNFQFGGSDFNTVIGIK